MLDIFHTFSDVELFVFVEVVCFLSLSPKAL